MKRLLLLFLFFPLLVLGQSLILSTPIDVATGYDNLRPRITLAQNDVPVVMWGTSGTNPIYVSRFNGSSFDTPVIVTPNGVDPFCSNWIGPDIASSDNDVWVVFDTDINGFRIYSVRSSDGGVSFGDTSIVGNYSGRNRFSSIGADENGNPMVIYMGHDLGWTNPNYVVCNSSDSGISWGPPISASNSITGNEVCDCCPSEIIADNNMQIALFRNNNYNERDIWACSSNNGGINYNGFNIEVTSWLAYSCPSSGPDGIIRGDTLIATWMTSSSGYSRVMLGTSNISTQNIGYNIEISPPSQNGIIQNHPRIAGDDSVYGVVYEEYNSGNYDVYLAYSSTWNSTLDTTSILVNDQTIGNQLNPDIVYSNDVFHIVYQDDKDNTVKYCTATLNNTDIHENINPNNLTIYPNPTNDLINLEINCYNGSVNVEVFDFTGKLLKVTNSTTISLKDYAKGIYIFKVAYGDRLEQRKVAKSK